MKCQRCESDRIMSINAKCSDLCFADIKGNEKDGYVPRDIGLKDTSGDYVELDYCLNCGQIQGNFPVDECALERGDTED